jgi:hypothetical protein
MHLAVIAPSIQGGQNNTCSLVPRFEFKISWPPYSSQAQQLSMGDHVLREVLTTASRNITGRFIDWVVQAAASNAWSGCRTAWRYLTTRTRTYHPCQRDLPPWNSLFAGRSGITNNTIPSADEENQIVGGSQIAQQQREGVPAEMDETTDLSRVLTVRNGQGIGGDAVRQSACLQVVIVHVSV